MVDLSPCEAVMRPKKKPRKYIDPDAFHLARRKAGLTVKATASALDVDERTIRNYEKGVVRIPYPSFRLVRTMAGFSLLGDKWEGWGFSQGKLWTPEGRSFEAHELRYIATYLQIARRALTSAPWRLRAPPPSAAQNPLTANSLVIAPTASARPSDATASFGAEVGQAKPQRIEVPHGLQEKASSDESYIREIG